MSRISSLDTTEAKEIWKPIPNFPDYEVSNLGRVRSLKFGRVRILRTARVGYGYQGVQLSSNGVLTHRFVHQLVMLAFAGPRPEGMEVCHGDDGLSDHLDNLRYDTHKANTQDCLRAGKIRKLSREQARELRQLHSEGVSYRGLMQRFGISKMTVWRTLHRQ